MLFLENVFTHENIDTEKVLIIRHTYGATKGNLPGVTATSDANEILAYTAKIKKDRSHREHRELWVVFVEDAEHNSRLHKVYENRGEKPSSDEYRNFDLQPTILLDEYVGRLAIEWPVAFRKWWAYGDQAGAAKVLEIADTRKIAFPGFNNFVLSYDELQIVLRGHEYGEWRAAFAAVKAVYLIADSSDGKTYVGKADGSQGLLQRWQVYAQNGHGGNQELKARNAQKFRFSVLQVFDPKTPKGFIDEAEKHYKEALLSRQFGLNLN